MTTTIRSLLAAQLLAGVFLISPAAWAQEPVINPLAETPDSGTMKRADKEDMALVLKKLQELGVKPIESRSIAEARTQPTPGDAAKAVLKDEGKTLPPSKVTKKDLIYPISERTQPSSVMKMTRVVNAFGAGCRCQVFHERS